MRVVAEVRVVAAHHVPAVATRGRVLRSMASRINSNVRTPINATSAAAEIR